MKINLLRFFAAFGGDAFEKGIYFFVDNVGKAKIVNKKINPFTGTIAAGSGEKMLSIDYQRTSSLMFDNNKRAQQR